MKRLTDSAVTPGHEDYPLLSHVREAIFRCVSSDRLSGSVAERTLQAAEIVLDPVRTARTRIKDLDKVEKTFVGLMIEHQIRDMLGVPKGLRRDLLLGGQEVDLKSTVAERPQWMIPPESYRENEVCLLVQVDPVERRVSMGLIVARPKYLGQGQGNRDKKQSTSAAAAKNTLWLVADEPWPRDRWQGLDMARFRELRRMRGGSKRAAAFFLENLERPIHRFVLQALLFDQRDYMKRLRENGGARDRLKPLGVDLVWGRRIGSLRSRSDLPPIGPDEFMAVRRTS